MKRCCRCKEELKKEEYGNKIQGNAYCDNCYPGRPPRFSKEEWRGRKERQTQEAHLKTLFPELSNEIDQIFKSQR